MRLGVLGGTFDPVHIGHLLAAEQAREILACDRVLLIPAGNPPHKPARVGAAYADRVRMLEIALAGIDGLAVSTLEADEGAPSYTVGTLRRLRAKAGPGVELWLLMGSDSLLELPTWREPETILDLASLGVYRRPGDPIGRTSGRPPELPADLARLLAGRTWRLLPGPRVRLSSSEIRRRAARGRSLRFLVPEAVREYILVQGLYR